MNLNINKIKPIWCLPLGIMGYFATHMSWGIDFFAWFSAIPFLLYLDQSKGWRSRLLFALALIAAWSLVIAKILSPPMPLVMVFLFSVPISLIHLPAYLIWSKYSQNRWATLLFPAVFVSLEWIQYSFTPFGSWGVMAYSQANSINIMQFASVFGLAGLSFLIYWVNASIVRIISTQKLGKLSFYLPALVLLLVIVFGSLRLSIGKSKEVEMMPVAAIETDSEVGGLPLPSKESNELVISKLIMRTGKAADFGAELIVWNEGAFYALPEDETKIIDQIKTVAKEKGVSLYAAYVVPLSEDAFKYENKYVFVNDRGVLEYQYLKHQPVPGEPAIQGKEALRVIDLNGSKVGGAICYDYDVPYLARQFGKMDADIVALPSSDWRGIDPLHTQMAAFRAVEQGHSIIRSTRMGLSGLISPYGEMLAQSSSFDEHNQILVSNIPRRGVATLYASIGDLFVFICLGLIVLFLGSVWGKLRFFKH